MKVDQFINTVKVHPKQFYRLVDFERLFAGETRSSLQKSLQRYLKLGLLTKLQKDVYISTFTPQPPDYTTVASQLYQPNYLSLESILFRHGVINQPVFGATFVTTRRTKLIKLANQDFWFSQVKPTLYWGYQVNDNMYEAELEKAVVDMLYLRHQGKRHFDLGEWHMKPVNFTKLKRYLVKADLSVDLVADLQV